MKSTLLGSGWVRSYGFARTLLALACVLMSVSGCAEDAREGTGSTTGGATDGTNGGASAGTSAGTTAGSTAGTNGDGTAGTSAGTNGDSTAGTTAGSSAGTTAGSNAGTSAGDTAGDDTDSDAGMMSGGTGGDIPSTPGNDSPTATSCTGTDTCTYATQTCCVGGVGDAMCVQGKKCPSGGLIPAAPTVCDGPEDCAAGKVCCVAVNPTGAANSCQDSCDKVSGLIGVWQLCHKDGDCPANKGACDADDTFPFWGFCS